MRPDTYVPDCVIVGGGGHATVVIDALIESGTRYRLGLTEPDETMIGRSVLGVPILGTDEILPILAASGTRFFTIGVGGVRDNMPRRRLFELALSAGLTPLTIIHPRSVVSRYAQLGDGCQILAGTIVNATAEVGDNVLLNTGCIVEHECTIASHANVSVGARLTGGVRIGEAAHVGAGAVIRQFLSVGPRAVVGAGAVVTKDVPHDCVVAGVPARIL